MSDYDEGYSAGKDELWERIAELEQQVKELEARLEFKTIHTKAAATVIENHTKTIIELKNKYDDLTAERDRLREALQEIVECADDYAHIVAKKALEDS